MNRNRSLSTDQVVNLARAWLKQQGDFEQRFTRKLSSQFFRAQAERVAGSLAKLPAIPSSPDALINVDDETEKLVSILRPELLLGMGSGALDELRKINNRRNHVAFSVRADEASQILRQLPEGMREILQEAVEESLSKPWWKDVTEQSKTQIEKILQRGLSEGLSGPQTADLLRQEMTNLGKARALRIARTESTGALNAGHQEARNSLAREGSKIKKVWLSINDRRTRPSHGQAHGQVVPNEAWFVLDSGEGPYPGALELPSAERIACRCVATTGKIEGLF